MTHIKLRFEEIKSTCIPEHINDFLIELCNDPISEYLEYIDYFIENLDPQAFKKVKLNIFFLLGEIGNLIPLPDNYLSLMEKEYYLSDRWLRNEIIQAIHKASKNKDLNEKTIELISNALSDEYSHIVLNALKLILNFKNIPDKILKHLILLMNSRDSELLDICRRIFEKYSQHPERIFHILDKEHDFKFLKPHGIRSLLLISIESIFNAESFRELIINSDWERKYKDNFMKELETFEKILLKKM
jgi:hypothetical protein